MTKFNIPEDLPPPLTVEETAELYGVNDVERNRIISKADAAFNRREAVEGHRKTEAEQAQWRPIETAPTDDTLFLVYAPGREGLPSMMSLCRWHREAGYCVDELREPTHWSAPARSTHRRWPHEVPRLSGHGAVLLGCPV